MKYTKKFSFAALMLVAGMGAAQAAVIEGSTNSASADVTFASPTSSEVTITPVTTLMAGEIPTLTTVATASVSASGGDVAWRWLESSGTVDPSNIMKITVKGRNNPQNSLKLHLSSNRADVIADGWIHPASSVTTGRDTEGLGVYTDTKQNVAADTYTLSIETAAWQA